jgi:hypothetical protein
LAAGDGLIEFPGPVYLNIEQSEKPPPTTGSLSQPTIDRAFANQRRRSTQSYRNGELVITQLARKNTRRVPPLSHLGESAPERVRHRSHARYEGTRLRPRMAARITRAS